MGVRWEAPGVYLALGPTDMRKQTNSLAAVVQGQLGLDVFRGELFVFCNRRGTLIKVLYWDENGFALWQKRLERHRFHWPVQEAEVLKMRVKDLEWILAGLDIEEAHGKLEYHTVV
jgi:transposase